MGKEAGKAAHAYEVGQLYATIEKLQMVKKESRDLIDVIGYMGQDKDKVMAFLRIRDIEELGRAISDEMLMRFRAPVSDEPIAGEMICGKDTVIVNFENLPDDHMIPEIVQMQKQYLLLQVIGGCRAKLFGLIDKELDAKRLQGLKKEALAEKEKLVSELLGMMTDEERQLYGKNLLIQEG